MRFEQPVITPETSATTAIACRWDAPGGAQRVTLSSVVIRDLGQAAIRAFLAIPRRGVEIGGLLFGQVGQEQPSTDAAETDVFEISAFESVSCEHRFGPSYTLDELDRNRLVLLLARHQQDGSPPVVGFYRSYTGRQAQLDEADQELIRTFFPHRHFVCLLLQPLSMQKCAAAFQFCNNGEVLAEPALAPFPFEAALMKQDAAPLAGAAKAAVAVPERGPAVALPERAESVEVEAPEIQPETPQPIPNLPAPPAATIPPPAPRRFPVVMALVFCFLVAIASAAIYELWNVARESHLVYVHFDARQSARALLLSWDATVPAVLQATRGVLAVSDGRNPVEIPLSPEQLHRGSLSYSPAQGDVLFQLRLYDNENPLAAESLRVIRLANPEAAAPAPAPVAVAAPAAVAAPVERPPAAQAAVPASPPTVLHEVQPVISPGIRARILARTVLPVMVSIDESGRVTRASSNVAADGLDKYLADEAVKAARLWRFSPARAKDGSPVAATRTISFEFAPGQ